MKTTIIKEERFSHKRLIFAMTRSKQQRCVPAASIGCLMKYPEVKKCHAIAENVQLFLGYINRKLI